jgi:hypothetical protein
MTHRFRLSTLVVGALLCTGAMAADQDLPPKAETHMQKVREALAALGAKPSDTAPVDNARQQPALTTQATEQ